jgi:hypothetical protein
MQPFSYGNGRNAFSSISVSWSGSSTIYYGSGSGSLPTQSFTRMANDVTPTGSSFSLTQTCCNGGIILTVGPSFGAFSGGSWSDSNPPSCSHTTSPLTGAIYLSLPSPEGPYDPTAICTLFADMNPPEFCINSGMFDPSVSIDLPISNLVGTHSHTTTGGSFGGSFSYTFTFTVS